MTKEELKDLEDKLWKSADTLRANSDMKASEYSTPVLGLIFLKFADNKYSSVEADINADFESLQKSRRSKSLAEIAILKCGFYLPPEARYDYLLEIEESEDLALVIKRAMEAIEAHKPELEGVLPKEEYSRLNRKKDSSGNLVFDNSILIRLLRNFANIPKEATGDILGQIYEYFLGNFAMTEGQGGGEFFTPRSVVRLMVEIIEPHQGTVFDPACGSGGMFVQSGQFVESRNVSKELSNFVVYGCEKTRETVKLAKMNLVVNGLRGEIQQANSYYEDPHKSLGNFDYVFANPPFNVDDVNLAEVEKDPRFNAYGVPKNKSAVKAKDKGTVTVPNANYLWINLFATSLKPKGRAGLVMANSASDARHSEADIRKNLIQNNLIYAMVTLPSNLFYTVTLPATLWFFDKGKTSKDILFIDARNIFTQIDRAHREFSEEQLQNIATICRLQRGDRSSFVQLVHQYVQKGYQGLKDHKQKLADAFQKLNLQLKENNAKDIFDEKNLIINIEKALSLLETYQKKVDIKSIDEANQAQRNLTESITPVFTELHEVMKSVDKAVRQLEKETNKSKDLKNLKTELEILHKEAKASEYYFRHVVWLEERFPEAKYEDVTGLCKLSNLSEVEEQEFSLNPGRYVGVVIEEDGKTEEEFISEMMSLQEELETLNKEAHGLESIIAKNMKGILSE